MVKSMTGFGKTTIETGTKKIVIEIKSLNSKQLDLSLRIPNMYKEKEMEIRSMAKAKLNRGKAEICIYFDHSEVSKDVMINKSIVTQYFNQLLDVSTQLGVVISKSELMRTVMRFPDTLQMKSEEPDEKEWLELKKGIEKALEAIDSFRIQEGTALMKDISKRVQIIQQLSEDVVPFESARIAIVRKKIEEKLNEWTTDVKSLDQNRMEQEIIYYLEKLDITEEKIRLANHCKYFLETAEKEDAPGRKLGFIAQEIGREINTMGSKANDHNIQKIVVRMKDELEKIKEQGLNVL